ncbi:type II toxin-antitoxin system YhaV family toxin [Mongoliimonas terrestris]|uniref:type II toxin-antitoxin system YhaV family toxin n=1 Tax=Mongoliimonas terrestris TaxID=1709001 RepID=UPI0009497EB2|nr:type II toxin-antitoxin system YhaV family toxin [Mongoliimonas terrestris]
MLTINGWSVLAHPLFLDQWEKLVEAVDALKLKRPDDYQKSADAKLLAALVNIVTVTVPSDPTAAIFRQGSTLGDDRRHWYRAKFGNGRFRLFFRYSSTSKVIIFAWVNDQNSLRTYGSRTDAYRVFKGMLNAGDPPDDWAALHKQASAPQAIARLEQASKS